MNAAGVSTSAARLQGIRQARIDQRDQASSEVDRLTQRKKDIDAAVAIIQGVAAATQDQLRVRLEDITQTALDVVFPGSYTFKVEFTPRRGRTEVDMWRDKDGTRMDPLDSNGGGVVDVISLALRICCLTLSTNARVLLLDEPFKFIRGRARQRLGDMLKAISRRLGIQVIMVADVSDTGIIPNREFKVGMKWRKSVIEARDPEASDA